MITMMNRLNAIASVAKSLWMNRRVVTRVVILSMMFSLANIYPCMNAAKVAIPTAAVRTDQTISNAVASVISSMVGLIANMIYFFILGIKKHLELQVLPLSFCSCRPLFAVPVPLYMGIYVFRRIVFVRINSEVEVFSSVGKVFRQIDILQMFKQVSHALHLQTGILPEHPLLKLSLLFGHFLHDDDE